MTAEVFTKLHPYRFLTFTSEFFEKGTKGIETLNEWKVSVHLKCVL